MSGNATRALGIQAETIRDIFGNPFRAEDVRLEWLAPEVRSLAEAMYQTGRFDRMPALARMLEGLGCTNMTILSHCSASSEHVRGCWVVDTILGKS